MSRPVHAAPRPPPPRTRPPPSPHLADEDDVEQQRHLSHATSTSSAFSAAYDSTGKHKSFSLISSFRVFYLRSPLRAILLLLLVTTLLVAYVVLSYTDSSYSLSRTLSQHPTPLRTIRRLSHHHHHLRRHSPTHVRQSRHTASRTVHRSVRPTVNAIDTLH